MSQTALQNQPSSPTSNQLGSKYLIKRELGRSQAYSLFQAVEIDSGQAIALKVFRRKFSADPRFALKFRHLMKTIFGTEDERLVSVLDYGISDGYYYIASEWIDGRDLGTYQARIGSLSEVQAISIGSQVCRALEGIHQNDLLHQNLKPQNILITSRGRVKLSDAGLSGLISESGLSRTHVMVGRYHYIAPEQVGGQEPTPESDLYSLGIVMYEMLTGQCPFDSQDVWNVLRMHTESDPPPFDAYPQRISPSLEKIVLRALQKSPSMRYSSAGEMNTALTTVLVDSVPSQADSGLTAADGLWEQLKDLARQGKTFLQSPAPFRFFGKGIPFALVLLLQFFISFLLIYFFLSSALTLSSQIRNNQKLIRDVLNSAVGSADLQKTQPKTGLTKQPQSNLEYPTVLKRKTEQSYIEKVGELMGITHQLSRVINSSGIDPLEVDLVFIFSRSYSFLYGCPSAAGM